MKSRIDLASKYWKETPQQQKKRWILWDSG